MERTDFPLTLTVKDVQQILRVSKDKAYEMTRRPGFPCLRDGGRIIIPRDAFFNWLEAAVSAS